jgi:catechol 2,3-dioxygenase-like lactoylglutathione lyase family enzyme
MGKTMNLDHTGVHSIDHFALAVPDLRVAAVFYQAFGLRATPAGDHLELRAAGHEHVWGRIYAGASKRLAYLRMNCHAADYVALSRRIAAHAEPAQPFGAAPDKQGCWFTDTDGNLLQLCVGPKTSADAATCAPPAPRAGVRGVLGRDSAQRVAPSRLSHVLLFATDVSRQIDFYRDVLGLALSDRSGDIVAFMHARHGCDHHLVAFAKSERRGWHHASWDVPGIEDVGLGWMQMQQAGYTKAWGPGRHVLGSNYFCYVEDPWGSYCEYSAGMDYVPAGAEWPAGDHPADDSFYLWGPAPPADFTVNDEVHG